MLSSNFGPVVEDGGVTERKELGSLNDCVEQRLSASYTELQC